MCAVRSERPDPAAARKCSGHPLDFAARVQRRPAPSLGVQPRGLDAGPEIPATRPSRSTHRRRASRPVLPRRHCHRRGSERRNFFSATSTSPTARALDDIGDGSRCHGHRPSISSTSVQLRKVRTSTRPASRPRLMKVNSCAMVFTMSAATSTSRPSRSERPMRIL